METPMEKKLRAHLFRAEAMMALNDPEKQEEIRLSNRLRRENNEPTMAEVARPYQAEIGITEEEMAILELE